MTAAISVSGLVKDFGTTRALDDLDLTVSAGEVHGFLGPNGAGKTTAIRVLLGLLRRDGGRVSVLGGDPWRDTVSLGHGRSAPHADRGRRRPGPDGPGVAAPPQPGSARLTAVRRCRAPHRRRRRYASSRG